MKTINIYGKKLSILAVLGIMLVMIGIASAVVAYFNVVGSVTVESPFSATPETYEVTVSSGENYQTTVPILNNANNPILVELSTDTGEAVGVTVTYSDADGIVLSDVDNDDMQELLIPANGGTDIIISAFVDVEEPAGNYTVTTHLNTPEDVDYVSLVNKDPDTWDPIGTMIGYVIYEIESSEFDFAVKADGLQTNTEYSLIYYVDQTDRFDHWGGVYPSVTLATITTGNYYSITDKDDMLFLNTAVTLGHNLPHPDDANANAMNHDYRGAPDYYEDATGAKLWLVPSTSINSNPAIDTAEVILNGWNPTNYLFEDGLVSYTYTV